MILIAVSLRYLTLNYAHLVLTVNKGQFKYPFKIHFIAYTTSKHI